MRKVLFTLLISLCTLYCEAQVKHKKHTNLFGISAGYNTFLSSGYPITHSTLTNAVKNYPDVTNNIQIPAFKDTILINTLSFDFNIKRRGLSFDFSHFNDTLNSFGINSSTMLYDSYLIALYGLLGMDFVDQKDDIKYYNLKTGLIINCKMVYVKIYYIFISNNTKSFDDYYKSLSVSNGYFSIAAGINLVGFKRFKNK